jgi:hypothetical protein
LRTTRAKSHTWPHRSSYNMSDTKPRLDPTSPSAKKRKTASSSSPDLKPQSPSKAKKTDHRHTFFGPVQKSGAWTQEEDKKLFQHMYPRATGLNWELIARDIEGRSLHVSSVVSDFSPMSYPIDIKGADNLDDPRQSALQSCMNRSVSLTTRFNST